MGLQNFKFKLGNTPSPNRLLRFTQGLNESFTMIYKDFAPISKELYEKELKDLKTFLFMLSIMGFTVFVKGSAEVSLKQWLLLLFFFCVAIILHLATSSKIRRFGKK